MKFFVVAASRQSAANSKLFQTAAGCRKPLRLMRAVSRLWRLLPVFFVARIFAQTNEPPTLVPAYGEISPTFLEQHGTIVVICGCAFLVLASLAIWKMLQPKPAVVLLPETIARDALARLQAQLEDGNVLSEVSQILRRYVGVVFQMPDAELTTAEFCAALARNDKITLQTGESISSFLRECDVRKFSPASSALPVNAVNRALEFVAHIENETRRRAADASSA